MCLIIDSCALSSVFDKKEKTHSEFRPVLEWILTGKGKIVYGGKKYKEELSKLKKILRIFGQLRRAGKVIEVDDCKVDDWADKLSEKIDHRDFDDPHIIAIVIVSKCMIICTKEKRALRFFKDNSLYPKGRSRPKLYTGKQNKTLLSDKYIANICLPTTKCCKELEGLFD